MSPLRIRSARSSVEPPLQMAIVISSACPIQTYVTAWSAW
jgi:hypothetical protein